MEVKSTNTYLSLQMQVSAQGLLECSTLPGSNPYLCWQNDRPAVVYYHGVSSKHDNEVNNKRRMLNTHVAQRWRERLSASNL